MQRLTDPAGEPPPGKLPAGMQRDVLAALEGARLSATLPDAWVKIGWIADQVGAATHDAIRPTLTALTQAGLVVSKSAGPGKSWKSVGSEARRVL